MVRQVNVLTRRATGKRLAELIHARILTEAERLLADTPLMIKEIAYELDFSGPDAFIHFYKNHRGIRPGDFRARQKVPSADCAVLDNLLKS